MCVLASMNQYQPAIGSGGLVYSNDFYIRVCAYKCVFMLFLRPPQIYMRQKCLLLFPNAIRF